VQDITAALATSLPPWLARPDHGRTREGVRRSWRPLATGPASTKMYEKGSRFVFTRPSAPTLLDDSLYHPARTRTTLTTTASTPAVKQLSPNQTTHLIVWASVTHLCELHAIAPKRITTAELDERDFVYAASSGSEPEASSAGRSTVADMPLP
jgi:hypothetical protein